MTEEDRQTGEFRGTVNQRLKTLEENMKTLHARVWYFIIAIGAVAASPYVDMIQALLRGGGQ